MLFVEAQLNADCISGPFRLSIVIRKATPNIRLARAANNLKELSTTLSTLRRDIFMTSSRLILIAALAIAMCPAHRALSWPPLIRDWNPNSIFDIMTMQHGMTVLFLMPLRIIDLGTYCIHETRLSI
jgi:hypothetical protein